MKGMNELGNTPADKNYRPSGIRKAEERALEAYPIHPTLPNEVKDYIAAEQQAYRKGYEQAEQDLALTAEDMQLVWQIIDTLNEEWRICSSTRDFFAEVLKRFNSKKK